MSLSTRSLEVNAVPGIFRIRTESTSPNGAALLLAKGEALLSTCNRIASPVWAVQFYVIKTRPPKSDAEDGCCTVIDDLAFRCLRSPPTKA